MLEDNLVECFDNSTNSLEYLCMSRQDIDEEMEEIKGEANSSNDSGSLSVWQLLKTPNLRLALFVTICMHLSQQLSGITAIFYYSTKFFQVSKNSEKFRQIVLVKGGVA